MKWSAEPMLNRWLSYTLGLADGAFVAANQLDDKVMPQLVESMAGIGFFVREDAHPRYAGKNTIVSVHVASDGGLDILKTEYDLEALGFHVVLLEGANFLVARIAEVNAGVLTSSNVRNRAESLLHRVMNTETDEHRWLFTFPHDFDIDWKDRLVSSNAALNVRDIESRHDRADLFIHDGLIHFIFYKKISQMDGFRNDDQWFKAVNRS